MPILNTILDIIFPVHCLGCGKRSSLLCLDCLSLFPMAERESAKWIFPLYDYRHPPLRKSLWLLKYNGKKTLAKIFGELVYARLVEELSELALLENFRQPILIPIPLSAQRHRERGYNQAELICREIIKLDGVAHLRHGVNMQLQNNILIKPRETEHQARIKDRRARLRNIQGSFTVQNAGLIQSRNIILIDDITTTGATLSEARKVLKQAGARKVIAFTVAH